MKIDPHKLPNFLVIGAGKSGTTSLDNYLRQHPEIFMCPVKEPNFFAYEKHSRSDFTRTEDIYHYEHSITELSEYLNLFKGSEDYKARGETSNTYLYGKYSIDTMLQYLDQVKLIVILRQPAERIYSRYMHLARENALPTKRFEDVFDKNSVWWERPDLVTEGFYYQHLSRFFDRFEKSQIKILFYDDLKSDSVKLVQDVFDFLEVDATFVPKNTKVIFNKSGLIKNKTMHKLVGPNGLILSGIKKAAPGLFKSLKETDFVKHKLVKLRSRNLSRPKLSEELRQKITNEIYLKDLLQLEKLINKPLNHWYK